MNRQLPTLTVLLPLKRLQCDFLAERDTEILRKMKTLEEINRKSAADFWQEVEKQ